MIEKQTAPSFEDVRTAVDEITRLHRKELSILSSADEKGLDYDSREVTDAIDVVESRIDDVLAGHGGVTGLAVLHAIGSWAMVNSAIIGADDEDIRRALSVFGDVADSTSVDAR